MTDEEIEAAVRSDPDAPPIDDDMWEEAVLVLPYKHMVCIRIDRDVLDWFRSQGRGYQTRMNAVLRSYMQAHTRSEQSNQQGGPGGSVPPRR